MKQYRYLLCASSLFYFAQTTCFSAWMRASSPTKPWRSMGWLRRISRDSPAYKLASASPLYPINPIKADQAEQQDPLQKIYATRKMLFSKQGYAQMTRVFALGILAGAFAMPAPPDIVLPGSPDQPPIPAPNRTRLQSLLYWSGIRATGRNIANIGHGIKKITIDDIKTLPSTTIRATGRGVASVGRGVKNTIIGGIKTLPTTLEWSPLPNILMNRVGITNAVAQELLSPTCAVPLHYARAWLNNTTAHEPYLLLSNTQRIAAALLAKKLVTATLGTSGNLLTLPIIIPAHLDDRLCNLDPQWERIGNKLLRTCGLGTVRVYQDVEKQQDTVVVNINLAQSLYLAGGAIGYFLLHELVQKAIKANTEILLKYAADYVTRMVPMPF